MNRGVQVDQEPGPRRENNDCWIIEPFLSRQPFFPALMGCLCIQAAKMEAEASRFEFGDSKKENWYLINIGDISVF